MAAQPERKLNRLESLLPEGLLVNAAWLAKHGYSTSLRRQYVTAGWLDHPTRQVYCRKRGLPGWQETVISLQTLLDQNLVVGGRTALELQGFAHYIAQETRTVHLYGPKHPPVWLNTLPLDVAFAYHNSRRLFRMPALPADLIAQPRGQWGWQLTMSSPERAVLELLDELPERETFEQVDKLVEGLASLRPRRLQKLLLDCKSVKVKRLFFFFADRHQHAWLKHLNKKAVDLGKGKRMLVRGGKLNAPYQITVPEDLDAAQ